MLCLFCFLDLKVSVSLCSSDLDRRRNLKSIPRFWNSDVSMFPVAKNNNIFEQVSWKDRIQNHMSIPESLFIHHEFSMA